MAKTLIQNVVQQLEHERTRLQTELHKVSAALTAFGRAYLGGAKSGRARGKRRTISAVLNSRPLIGSEKQSRFDGEHLAPRILR